MSRPPLQNLSAPSHLPSPNMAERTDAQWLALASRQNPELIALSREMAGNRDAITMAQLKYLPDFSLTVGTDLKGLVQSLAGMVTVPFLRNEAIDAAIAQAEAHLRQTEAIRRQTADDLAARVIADLLTLHEVDRQIALFEAEILPRVRQTVTLNRSAYETSHATLLDLIDSQRSLINVQKLVAELRTQRAERLADLESITAVTGESINAYTLSVNVQAVSAAPPSR